MAKGTFGERLKRERELREVSLNEVTVATRIGTRFLEALENEDWDKLPGGVFNRGFVRSVARYLGLDEENLLAEYDMARGGDPVADIPAGLENRIPSPPKWILPAIIFAALLIIAGVIAAGVYGWQRYSAHRKARQSSTVFVPLRRGFATSAGASAQCSESGGTIEHGVAGIERHGHATTAS
jgi:cytoskeletal protein RodZ